MPADRPNILVIWGDDIGISNLSCYSDGLMGYRTPNIDRIADGGRLDSPTTTASRAAPPGGRRSSRGQNPIRTGLTKVGMPGAAVGLQAEDPTIATALKAHGYATGQFGKNHLGDRDEHLPTVHGFDEFFGNLYHLNAEEEPELADYPTPEDFPDFRERFGPRGVLHSWADKRRHAAHRGHRPADQEADGDRRRRVLRARRSASSGTRPLANSRSSCGSTPPTCTSARTSSRRAGARPAGGSPSTTTRCSTTTGSSGSLLDLVDELGIAENTIVIYSTDNGPHMNTLAGRRDDAVPR